MLMMPLHEMQSWFENKPLGFGEGKIYDTSAEDKIVEEMEQTRRAQLANINKLKHSSPQQIAAMKKKEMEMQKGISVCLFELVGMWVFSIINELIQFRAVLSIWMNWDLVFLFFLLVFDSQ